MCGGDCAFSSSSAKLGASIFWDFSKGSGIAECT